MINRYITKIDSDTSLIVVYYEGDCAEEYLRKNPDCGVETINSFNRNIKSLCRLKHNEFGDSTRDSAFYYHDDKLVFAQIVKGYLFIEENSPLFKTKIFLSNNPEILKTGSCKRMTSAVVQRIGLSYLIAHNKIYGNKN